jgi:16S rRNA C967 or C1407 C5-methylase (RsmB/RsmF family)/NOL1/NOP2/fmu family ribosome biogenesis protein
LLPEKFIASLEGLPGFNQETFVQTHEAPADFTSVRLNQFKPFDLSTHPFMHNRTSMDWCKDGCYLSGRPSFVVDPLWHAGAYYVQEASSMFLQTIISQLADPNKYYKVLDLCAAPGGKTTLLANAFKNGLVVANETIKSRNAILEENCIRWGSDHIVVTQNDPSHFKALPNFFDFIIADAPCSGSGLFRKDPQAIQEWSLENVLHCSQRQERIIEESITALQEGGYYIYSTCSYSFEEDEKIMDYIASIDGMQSVSIQLPATTKIVTTFSPKHNAQGFRFYPDKIQGEGFFITVFQKQSAAYANQFSTPFQFATVAKKELAALEAVYTLHEQFTYIQHQEEMIALPSHCLQDLQTIRAHLYVKKIGMRIGILKGKDLVPAHDLAMSQWAKMPYADISVALPDALQFLRRADFSVDAPKGWHSISYMNCRLGWVKILPNRLNNYYPNSWRILNY